MNIVLDAGADDLRDDGGTWEILSPPEAHEAVSQALEKAASRPNRPKSPWSPKISSGSKVRTPRPCFAL